MIESLLVLSLKTVSLTGIQTRKKIILLIDFYMVQTIISQIGSIAFPENLILLHLEITQVPVLFDWAQLHLPVCALVHPCRLCVLDCWQARIILSFFPFLLGDVCFLFSASQGVFWNAVFHGIFRGLVANWAFLHPGADLQIFSNESDSVRWLLESSSGDRHSSAIF